MRIILSRTDSIGDVILTLPMAGILKEKFPGCKVIFLGRNYSRPLVEACRFVDEFVDWELISGPGNCGSGESSAKPAPSEALAGLRADVIIHVFPVKEICNAAKAASIPKRIATSHRFFTVLTCNHLLHYSRRYSLLHEVQLNLKLLKPLGINKKFVLKEIFKYYGLTINHSGVKEAPRNERFKLILHPKSNGNAREWGLDNFGKLIDLLPPEKFDISITGNREEGSAMRGFLDAYHNRITDLTGKLSLPQLLELIAGCDALIAASTGPLHIAAALGIRAIGLYAPMRPIFSQRWAPLGEKADFLGLAGKCNDCRRSGDCHCIRSIPPERVLEKLN